MTARNLRNYSARNKCLFDNAGLVIIREPTPTPSARDHLKPVQSLRLKRMVKLRHKTISPSEIIIIADQRRQKKVGPPQRLRSIASIAN